MQALVRTLLAELQVEGIAKQDFDNWLVANQRDKVAQLAQVLRGLGSMETAIRKKRVDAFLSSVFWLKLSLLLETIHNAKINYFSITSSKQEEDAKLARLSFLSHWKTELLPIRYAVFEERALLKPTIARRVALMHGTTKARWEREARAF
ncbi:hypothetical protein JCM10296v2_005802 [Rhodotorula toruloides]